MKSVNHKELRDLINHCYEKKNPKNENKIPILVYGTFGVGKSAEVMATAESIAKNLKKDFKDWNCLSKLEKEEYVKNPKGKFFFIDKRLSENDPSDIKGIPDLEGDFAVWKGELWTKLLSHPESDGILFFDEIGNSAELVRVSCYKIIYDRIIGESRISNNWLILGASNLDTDKANVDELQVPLRDRACEVVLKVPNKDDWLTNYAHKNKFDHRIVSYIHWKGNQSLYNFNNQSHQKPTSPRGWERINTLIQGITDINTIELIAYSSISESIAGDFIAYLKLNEKMDIKGLIDDPQKLKNMTEDQLTLGQKFFVTSAFADHYVEKKIGFKKIMEISQVYDEMSNPEFVKMLWNICMNMDPKKWADDFMNIDRNNPLRDKYHKFLC